MFHELWIKTKWKELSGRRSPNMPKLTAPNEIWQQSDKLSVSDLARAEGIKHFLSNHCVWSRAFPVYFYIVPFCCSLSSPPHLPLPVASPTSVWPPIPGLCRGDLRTGWVHPSVFILHHFGPVTLHPVLWYQYRLHHTTLNDKYSVSIEVFTFLSFPLI